MYVQDIDVHSQFLTFVVTLLVMRHFQNLLGASRACADVRDSTAFFRLNIPSPIRITLNNYATPIFTQIIIFKCQ